MTTYDPAGQVLTVRDPNGVGYDVVYDQLGRTTSQTDTWGDTSSMTYDKEGNVLTQTDAKAKVTTMVFDARNRAKTVTDRLAGVTQYNYDCCHLVSIVDAEGQMTGYEYNELGQKIKETYPDHIPGSAVGTPGYGIVQFAFDPAGRMFRKTDQLGDTVTMNYNLASQMHQRDYRTLANSPTGTIADSDTFTFDSAGRMLSATSGRYSNVVGMTYDFAGRLATELLTIANQTYNVGHEFDTLGRPFKTTYPDGTIVERTFNDRGQLNQTKYAGLVVDTRSYDIGGRLASSVYNNGVTTNWAYRSNGSQKDNLPASINFVHPGGTPVDQQVGNLTYSWDASKNKTKETIAGTMAGYSFDTTPGSDPDGYDDENRLTYFKRSSSATPQTWNLSLVGDWNSVSGIGFQPVTQTRTHGPAHEFTSFTGAGSGTIQYDAKGNMTSRPATLAAPGLNLTWDFDNRMIGADTNGTPPSLEVTVEYDALGRRVARTEGSDAKVFVHSGQQVVADYNRGTASATPSYRYVWGSYIDEPILRQTGTTTLHYYHHNQQFSTVALTDNTGLVVDRYGYTAHGELSILDNTGTAQAWSVMSNRYTYTGREWDDNLAMFYFRARWFDSNAGRFTSRDPVGVDVHPNTYCGFDLVAGADPSGMIGIFFEGTGQAPGNSTVMHRLAFAYGGGTSVIYWTNFWPNNIWPNIKDAHKRICDEVCMAVPKIERCTKPTQHEPVDLFGWSRGAVAAITLGKRLKDQGCECTFPCLELVRFCERRDKDGNVTHVEKDWERVDKTFVIKPIGVRFMGLIDPVTTGAGQMLGTTTQISDNVKVAWAAMSTERANIGHVFFRSTTPTVEDPKKTSLTIKNYKIRHQWIGWDDGVHDDMKAAAIGAGVPFE